MLKQLAYIIAGMFENAANMIYDAIDMNPHAEPELYVSRECLDEMSDIERQMWAQMGHDESAHLRQFGWPQTAKDIATLFAMLAQQETKH